MEERSGEGLRLLVVDDEPAIRSLVGEIVKTEGFEVVEAGSLQEAEAALAAGEFDLLLVDKNLPDGSGIALAERSGKEAEGSEVLIMTAYASLDSAIEALRQGAGDYLIKPFEQLQIVRTRIRQAVERLRLRRAHRELVDKLRQRNQDLEALATRDALTGLFNHVYFQERLGREISRCKRYEHALGLMFIDIDRFKNINDAHGHQAGDAVLRSIAEVLRGASRATDYRFRLREHDIAARYGGDEFVLMLPETSGAGTAITAERLRKCVENEVPHGAVPRVTISVGVANFPEDGNGRDALIAAADTALYAAKHGGRNRVVAYSPGLRPHEGGAGRTSLDVRRADALREAIAKRAFRFVYQPIVRADSRETVGYEALCRPEDPLFSGPAELIATAERTGTVGDLGRVLRAMALEPLASFTPGTLVFVNLHPQELNDPALVEVEPGMQPRTGQVVYEITRSGSIQDQQRLHKTLGRLRKQGFRIALDDLGAGYLGLAALTRLEPEYVKLDMAALRAIRTDERAHRLIKHFMEYAGGEDIQVIAHGIERDEDLDLALGLGCPLLLQGYYFGEGEPAG